MVRPNAKRAVKSLQITLASGTRFKPRQYSGNRDPLADSLAHPACLDLENHFLSLLLQILHVERLTLDGDVPPSFELRVQLRGEEEDIPGVGLRIRCVGEQM